MSAVVQPSAFQIGVLPLAVRLLLQADRQVDAGLEALGVDAVGDGLHAVREAAGSAFWRPYWSYRASSPCPPPAGVDVDVLVAVLLQLGSPARRSA
jgi:hypothetical protein